MRKLKLEEKTIKNKIYSNNQKEKTRNSLFFFSALYYNKNKINFRRTHLDLEIFECISEILEEYESKKDIYKLIAEEVKDFLKKVFFLKVNTNFH